MNGYQARDTFDIYLGIAILIVFVVILLLEPIVSLSKERSYIKMEMSRSEGREYRYWRKKLKILYISHIPILGRIIIKFMK